MKLIRKLNVLKNCLIGDRCARYEARYTVLSALADKMDFRLYNRNLAWVNNAEFLKVWKQFAEGNDYVHERRFNLYYLAKATAAIKGDTVECGVFRGAGSHLILAATKNEPQKHHHIFDSFSGLSMPTGVDMPKAERTYRWQEHDLAAPEELVRMHLSRYEDRVTYYQGWIPARFDEIKDRMFSFVHIDVDLYEPTYESIAFFYPRMTRGGLIVCDDYGSEACPGAFKAMNDYISDKVENIVHMTTGQGAVIKS